MTPNTDLARAPELLPCPFCGKPPKHDNAAFAGYPVYVVRCCLATTGKRASMSDAITAWNRRAAIQQAAGAVRAEASNELGDLIACFDAAFGEGLSEALAETTDDRLKDLVERRLIYGYWEAVGPSPRNPTPAAGAGGEVDDRDAARYQWLREHSDSMSLNPPLTVAKVTGWGLEGWSGDDLNSAIDAAIAASPESVQGTEGGA